MSILLLLAGCSLDGILKSDALPPNVNDPARTETAAGAVEEYYGALSQFRLAFAAGSSLITAVSRRAFVSATGMLSDELEANALGNAALGVTGTLAIDARLLPEGQLGNDDILGTYTDLQRARNQAGLAIGLLMRYAPDSQRPLAGHLYALKGYTEVFLAELFCSGVPLSTVDFNADYTLSPGVASADVYRHAIALFDTALALAADSARIVNLATVGRARALLDLGEAAQAAAAVSGVPDGYRYEVTYTAVQGANGLNFAFVAPGKQWVLNASDRAGLNGLPYRSSNDPRTRVTGVTSAGVTIYHPDKYATVGNSPVVLASGVEARLIGAEAALQAGSSDWLAILNALRTDGMFDTRPNAQNPAKTDTLWHAGTGGVAGLGPLSDPGGADARVDLLFRERAAWLFLTGHRQGDLRRLIRIYGRSSETVYPTGPYPSGGRFGGDVTLPIPPEERTWNPRFTGCLARGA